MRGVDAIDDVQAGEQEVDRRGAIVPEQRVVGDRRDIELCVDGERAEGGKLTVELKKTENDLKELGL